jgi:hypothetical protein
MSAAVDCDGFQQELPDLVYGQVDPEVRTYLDEHRASCSACAAVLAELQAVKGALPEMRPPPLLAARVKLLARDELLARQAADEQAKPAPPVGPTLHLAAVAVLAACVGVVGFVLGTRWREGEPSLEVPRGPGDVATEPRRVPGDPTWIGTMPPGGWGPDELPSTGPQRPVPRAPEAWQRVLFDSAKGMAQKGEVRQAREFYRRAVAVAPDGPLAAEAQVALAELMLVAGERDEGLELLEATRRDILAGKLVGGPTLLQRIAELSGS